MKLLLVEDDENKRLQLLSFLSVHFPSYVIDCAESLIGALRLVKRSDYHIILLDMTLPNYDQTLDGSDGGMHAFGGEELLRQLRRWKTKTAVIVVTQFETFGEHPYNKNLSELDAELGAEFSDIYRGAIYYHASLDDWIPKLQAAITKVSVELRNDD